jgi:hypothetical protein
VAPDESQRNDAITKCLGLRRSRGGRRARFYGPDVRHGTNRQAQQVVSLAVRYTSLRRERAVRESENAPRYLKCLRQDITRQAKANTAPPLEGPVVVSRLDAGSSEKTGVRWTYTLRLADGPGNYIVDRYTLWADHVSTTVTFFSIGRPFDAATEGAVTRAIRTRLDS